MSSIQTIPEQNTQNPWAEYREYTRRTQNPWATEHRASTGPRSIYSNTEHLRERAEHIHTHRASTRASRLFMIRTTISVFEIYVYQVPEHSLQHYWESFHCRATISNVQDTMTLWLRQTWHNITKSSLCACVLANMNESWMILYIHAYDTLHVLIIHTNSLASLVFHIYFT